MSVSMDLNNVSVFVIPDEFAKVVPVVCLYDEGAKYYSVDNRYYYGKMYYRPEDNLEEINKVWHCFGFYRPLDFCTISSYFVHKEDAIAAIKEWGFYVDSTIFKCYKFSTYKPGKYGDTLVRFENRKVNGKDCLCTSLVTDKSYPHSKVFFPAPSFRNPTKGIAEISILEEYSDYGYVIGAML